MYIYKGVGVYKIPVKELCTYRYIYIDQCTKFL